ncbi:MAG: hypothetical protein H8E62_04075 [Planctomycetes bacterium]|nr:hypothetical protein [Planctomycetota bacterium]
MNAKPYLTAVLCFSLMMVAISPAVTSVITRHNSSGDFLKGETDDVIIGSTGTLSLSPKTEAIETGDFLDDVWSIHTMVTDADGGVYLGTGPNAKVLRYADGAVTQVYSAGTVGEQGDDPNMYNQHVFAMAKDLAGRLLVGVSGEKGQLIRLSKEPEVVFEDEKVQYIFAVALDEQNNVYLGTGPNGLVYRLDPFCQNAELIYEARDKNILSLLVKDGVVYAGSDERGLIYKIDPEQKRAQVLFDTEQNEVAGLLIDADGNLFAAGTSAAAVMLQLKTSNASLKDSPGRPDNGDEGAGDGDGEEESSSSTTSSMNTANVDDKTVKKEEPKAELQVPRPPAAKVAGHIYKISPEGFVTDIFEEMAVFYSLLEFDGKLWLGTGNKAQLYTVDPATEEKAVYYEDETSSQITSLLAVGETLYMGLSNPARLVCLEKGTVAEGVYESELIDAGQPARWGKLQLEADIPGDCEVLLASRSGNVKEPNDPTFSDWSADAVLTQATELNCPAGRFCQYRLTLKSSDQVSSPEIREVAAAFVIPNLVPNVKAIKIQRSRDKGKSTIYDIGFAASDDNKDALEFTLEFRKLGRTGWILLKEELDKPRFEWDSRTVEDGRYEVRVTANDRKSNTAATELTGSRISDPVVIDNTAPVIRESAVKVDGRSVQLLLSVEDAYTVVGKVEYTVDSNDKWMGTLPDDKVYDTLAEDVTIQIDDLASGEHVIAVSVSDDLQNTMYKTFEVTMP